MAARGYVRRIPRARAQLATAPPTSAALRLAAARKSPEQEDYDAALEVAAQMERTDQTRHGASHGIGSADASWRDEAVRAALVVQVYAPDGDSCGVADS